MSTNAEDYVIVYDPNGNPIRVKRSALEGHGQEPQAEERGMSTGAKLAVGLGGAALAGGTAYYFRDEIGQGYDATKDAVQDGIDAYKKDGLKAGLKTAYDSLMGKDDKEATPVSDVPQETVPVSPSVVADNTKDTNIQEPPFKPEYLTLNPDEAKPFMTPIDLKAALEEPAPFKPEYLTLNPDDAKPLMTPVELPPVYTPESSAVEVASTGHVVEYPADGPPIYKTAEPSIDPSSVVLSDVPANPDPFPSKSELVGVDVSPVTPAVSLTEMLTPLPDPERVPLGVVPDAPPVVVASASESPEVVIPEAPADKYAGLDPQTRSVAESLDRIGMDTLVADQRAQELQIGKYAPKEPASEDIRNGSEIKEEMLAAREAPLSPEALEAKLGGAVLNDLASMKLDLESKGMLPDMGSSLPEMAAKAKESLSLSDVALNIGEAVNADAPSMPLGLDVTFAEKQTQIGG